jgi:hypothetical protein
VYEIEFCNNHSISNRELKETVVNYIYNLPDEGESISNRELKVSPRLKDVLMRYITFSISNRELKAGSGAPPSPLWRPWASQIEN